MGLIDKISAFFAKYLFNAKWRCVNCNKEIFEEEYFCEDCKSKLDFNGDNICDHCGRKLNKKQDYCTTCKGRLTNVDKARSVYNYAPPISTLIKRMKYSNGRYLAQAFAKDLANLYMGLDVEVDLVVYVPATEKSKKKRGYNQAELLAIEFCKITGIKLVECMDKIKETDRQATLDRKERNKNLKNAFRVKDKKAVKDKVVLIIDDVTTTGSTAENIAKMLKKAKAKAVYSLSIASVPPKDGY